MTSKFKNYHGSKDERVGKELRWFSKTLTSLLAIPLPSQTHNNYFNSISVLYLLYLNSFINLTMMIFDGQYLTKSAYNFFLFGVVGVQSNIYYINISACMGSK